MRALQSPETRQSPHVAFARMAAKSDWLAAANCLDLAFKRTKMGVNDTGHRVIINYAYSFDPNSARQLLRRSWDQGWSR